MSDSRHSTAMVFFAIGAFSAVGAAETKHWTIRSSSISLEIDASLLNDHGIHIHAQDSGNKRAPQSSDSISASQLFFNGMAGMAELSNSEQVGADHPEGRLSLNGDFTLEGPAGSVIVRRPSLVMASVRSEGAALGISGEVDGVRQSSTPVFTIAAAKRAFDRASGTYLFESDEVRISDAIAERIGARALAGKGIGTVRGRLNGAALIQVDPAEAVEAGGQSVVIAGGNGGTVCDRPIGPDIIVGDLYDVANYNTVGNIDAFTMGTFSCNVGDANAIWIDDSNQHPVISQNLFRLKNGRFEQVGQAWLKHGFLALTQNVCGCGCNGQGGSVLGVGCADPYSAGLNGSQGGMGPKWQVNAHTGAFAYPYDRQNQGSGSIDKRLQVNIADLEAAGVGGSTHYYIEGHYISPDDATMGNGDNNASYRRAFISGSMSTWAISISGAPATVREKYGIQAWKAADPTVKETEYRVPGEGLFILASKSTNLGNGFWSYEYGLQNTNSDRSAGYFSVSLGNMVTVQNIGFHDVPYHSGEPFDGTDWSAVVANNAITWSTTPHSSNPNANALRWATLYNFRFEANAAPSNVFGTIGLFKPGTPGAVSKVIEGPGECATDADCDDGLFCNGMEICAVASGACRNAVSPCTSSQVCDEVLDQCIDPIGCGPCKLYGDLAAPYCVVDITDILAGLQGYEETQSCSTLFGSQTPGSMVWNAGCWIACDSHADCIGPLGQGSCVGGQCCDICEITEILKLLAAFDGVYDCPHLCSPGACNFDTNADTVADCCKDGNTFIGGMSESDCFVQGGTYLGDGTTCILSACSP